MFTPRWYLAYALILFGLLCLVIAQSLAGATGPPLPR